MRLASLLDPPSFWANARPRKRETHDSFMLMVGKCWIRVMVLGGSTGAGEGSLEERHKEARTAYKGDDRSIKASFHRCCNRLFCGMKSSIAQALPELLMGCH